MDSKEKTRLINSNGF